MTAKVWTHHDEIWLTFYEYYVDEDGNSSVLEKYKEGYRLIRMKKAGDAIITEWCGIEPLLFGNEEPGEYFTKDKNSWLLAWESFLSRYILYAVIMISEMILFLMAVRQVSEKETEKKLIKRKDKSYKSKVKTILLTSLAVVLVVGGGYVAIHGKCRVVVGRDGNCYVEDGLFEKRGDVKSLKVPKGATGIGDQTFCECWRLSSVSLPEGLTSIGDNVFHYSGLEKIRMTKKQAKDIRHIIPEEVVIVVRY